jgi:hypothetical protein
VVGKVTVIVRFSRVCLAPCPMCHSSA